jgi:uncharacterized membrane protein YjfL (UPF0719 family)
MRVGLAALLALLMLVVVGWLPSPRPAATPKAKPKRATRDDAGQDEANMADASSGGAADGVPEDSLVAHAPRPIVATRIVSAGRAFACFPLAAAIANECIAEGAKPTVWTAAFGAIAFVAFVASGELGLRTLLGKTLIGEIGRGNVAAAIVAAAHYVAVGWIAAHAFAGTDARGLGLSAVFFTLAIVTLHIGTVIFRAVTEYDDRAQVESGNVAAAVSYAGLTVAMGILVASALDGDFEGWAVSLQGYGYALVFALAIWPVRQVLVQSILLRGAFRFRGGALDEAIAGQGDVGAAVLEAASYVGTGLLCASL